MSEASLGGSGSEAPPRRAGPGARWLAVLAMLLSLTGTLVVLELALRIQRASLFALPTPAAGVRMLGELYPGSHDPRLGFVPTPGDAPRNVWGTTVTITAEGLRSNGAGPRPEGAPILAVGDSFTFGDEVSDSETWPAQLERLVGRPVLNGGVFGYGLDQITLRSEALLERFPAADTLIVSLIPDDVNRCEYAYRYAWKPYFEVEGDALALRNVPVPQPHRGPPEEALWRRAIRWSFLADLVMRRLDPDAWLLPDSVRVHRQGMAVARLLVDRLADQAERRGHRLLLMLQWHPDWDGRPASAVLDRAAERGVEVLRVEPLLLADSRDSEDARRFFHLTKPPDGVGHMTALGNARVARYLADRLASPAEPVGE